MSNKVLLPVWHGVDHAFVQQYSPMLADKLAVSTEKGIKHVAEHIFAVLRGDDRIVAPPPALPRPLRGKVVLIILACLVCVASAVYWRHVSVVNGPITKEMSKGNGPEVQLDPAEKSETPVKSRPTKVEVEHRNSNVSGNATSPPVDSFFAALPQSLSRPVVRDSFVYYEGGRDDTSFNPMQHGFEQCAVHFATVVGDTTVTTTAEPCAPPHPRYIHVRVCIEAVPDRQLGNVSAEAGWYQRSDGGKQKIAATTFKSVPVIGGECFFTSLGGDQFVWQPGHYAVDTTFNLVAGEYSYVGSFSVP